MQNQDYPAPMGAGMEMVDQGRTLTRIEAGYQTAIKVQEPRKLKEVTDRCLAEADIAGESFFWTWQVWNSRTNKHEIVEGPSIDLAMTVARNFGNCAVPTEVVEVGDEWIFRAAFVDLETGFTFQRVYRKTRSNAPGKYDQDRWDDMQFQAAQSRAQRNVIVKGAPSWLIEQVMDRAKEASLRGIGKMGKETAKTKVLKFFLRYQVSREMLEKYIRKPIKDWTAETLSDLRGVARTLQDGQETAESMFGHVKAEAKADENVKDIEAFYQHLKNLGVERDDKDLYLYIKETADFAGESEESIKAQLGKAFADDSSQADMFIKAFRKKHPLPDPEKVRGILSSDTEKQKRKSRGKKDEAPRTIEEPFSPEEESENPEPKEGTVLHEESLFAYLNNLPERIRKPLEALGWDEVIWKKWCKEKGIMDFSKLQPQDLVQIEIKLGNEVNKI